MDGRRRRGRVLYNTRCRLFFRSRDRPALHREWVRPIFENNPMQSRSGGTDLVWTYPSWALTHMSGHGAAAPSPTSGRAGVGSFHDAPLCEEGPTRTLPEVGEGKL